MTPWTKMHAITWLPCLIIFVAITWFLAKKLKDKDEFIKMLPTRIIAILIVIFEIFKQVISIKEGYSLYHLPFHFCSLFVFLFPLFAFYKGKYAEHIKTTSMTACTMLLMFMLICPNTIYSNNSISEFFIDLFSFHTVIFHNIVIFGFLYILFSETYTIDTKRDYKSQFVIFSIYSAIACVVSQVLKENFNSFYTCRLSIVEEFRLILVDKIGWWAQLIYVIGMYIVTLLFGILCYWILRGLSKLYIKILSKINKDSSK